MADVYLAEDQQLGRKVALKLLHRRFAEDPGFVERFRREAQAAARLQHPNIVGVYDRGAYDGTYYIAMEYLGGRSLKQLVREQAPLDPLRAIDITIQILKAARFAHRHGVIHRDLKPHNVIVDDSDQAKVTDFGIARAGASDMTETGSIMGTAQYLSPEQAQGHAVSATSDIYSIAVVLYELLTGRVPFDADAAVTIALKHVSESPTAPTVLNPNVPPEVEQVVLWALNKDPAQRPRDADEFIAALERAKQAILAGRSGQRTAEMAALAGVGVGAVPAAAAGGGLGGVAAPVAEKPGGDGAGAVLAEPPLPPDHPARRRRRWPWMALLLALLLAGGGLAAYLLTRPAKKVVPAVVGEQLNIARTQLDNAGFSVNVINVTNNKPKDTVIGQDPPGGTKADERSTVQLTVSQGPGNVPVPSVTGLPSSAAQRAIKQAGLKVGRTQTEASDTIPDGSATRTDPAAGISLPVGSAVTLFISSGKPKVTVPDVTGQSQSDARSTLRAAGFGVATTHQTSTTASNDTVISQSPAGGTLAAPGSTVTLVIATAPTTATVPDVKGKAADAANGALTAAGFTVTQNAKDVNNKAQDGVVIDQSPGGGSTAPKGSNVTITVGHFKAPSKKKPTTTSPGSTTTTGTTTT
jgi:serine/threonine-protein kinase